MNISLDKNSLKKWFEAKSDYTHNSRSVLITHLPGRLGKDEL
tara:strand:- start:214 stop:339 length:126 start_codon:yes stop_codon:yes gene_type:complete